MLTIFESHIVAMMFFSKKDLTGWKVEVYLSLPEVATIRLRCNVYFALLFKRGFDLLTERALVNGIRFIGDFID